MPRKPTRSLAKLPQLDDTWLIVTAQMKTWIAPPDAAPSRPFIVFIVSTATGAIRASEITEADPTPAQVRDALVQAMTKPGSGAGKPGRPHAIVVTAGRLVEVLAALFTAAGAEVDIYESPMPPEVMEIVRALEDEMRGGPDHPGFLTVPGVTPELVGGFFAAAAAYYRAAPWVRLTNYHVLALRHPAETEYRYAVVMGNGGVEYGLAMYKRWADFERSLAADDPPEQMLPKDGLHSMFFDDVTRMSFADLEAMEQYGWELAGENAYPIAIVVMGKRDLKRPDAGDMRWYEAALRAVPLLVRDYLQPDGRGDFRPLETSVSVPVHDGTLALAVKYPAGTLPLGEQPMLRTDWGALEDRDERPSFDRRAMEGAMFQAVQRAGAQPGRSDPKLEQAQQLMYRAWEERNPAKRIALAHDALVASADCADAYVLLAEEEAPNVNRALEYYERGVAAAERALGPQYFEEMEGHFWGVLETRPYMRARHGLADALWKLHRYDEAIGHYRGMLRLNPDDNQGVRYLLVGLLLSLDRDAEATLLLAQYAEDWSATWLYSRALIEFRKDGASAPGNAALSEALGQNRHVPAYLTGRKRVPNALPDYIGMGDENEAIAYAADHLNRWRSTPGAVGWLTERIAAQRSRIGKDDSGRRKVVRTKQGQVVKGRRSGGRQRKTKNE